MKVMLNTKKSQLREVLEALGGTDGDVDVVINIKDEESKEEFSAFAFTQESLEKVQQEMKKDEIKDEKSKEKH